MNLDEFQKWMSNRLTWQVLMSIMIGGTIGAIQLYKYLKRGSSSSSSTSSGKAAVALAEDKSTTSRTFARAFYYKVNGKIYENPYREVTPAGGPAAEYVASLGAKQVIAGAFGPNALRRLRELGVTATVAS